MNANAPRPICFMVMPYGTKKTDAAPGTPPLGEINFDLLWDRALRPAIEQLGYEPVRADQDIGALIIHEMLERLYFSDVVLADMTIPNGNVYYEVGIRHACKEFGCVLLAADWSKQLFDVAQNRTVHYPLPAGVVDDSMAAQIVRTLTTRIPPLLRGPSPMYQVLPGLPSNVDASRASTMRKQLTDLAGFQARTAAVRAAPRESKTRMLAQLLEDVQPPMAAAVAHGLLNLCRDLGAWQEILSLLGRLPEDIVKQPQAIELKSLAQAKLGDPLSAIAGLLQVISTHGTTSEREGLLGGRYKELYRKATGSEKKHYLNEAILHYERGMMVDLNDYYPSSNLPRLYRARGLPDDAEKARATAQAVYFACQRAKRGNTADEWLRPTLLAAAFDAADVSGAKTVYEQIEAENAQGWKLDTTLSDIELSVQQVEDPARRAELAAILVKLRELAGA
jgi:hypothetical protein